MRQAGRSLPEYRRARSGLSMLESCSRPELVAEITLQPVRRYGVDAAILYSDIMLPLKAAGVDLDIVPGTGPVIAEPIRTAADSGDVPSSRRSTLTMSPRRCGSWSLSWGCPVDRLRRRTIHPGQLSHRGRTQSGIRQDEDMMLADPVLWHELCIRLADISAAFEVQIRSRCGGGPALRLLGGLAQRG